MEYNRSSAINRCLLTYWYNIEKVLRRNYMNYGTNCTLILHKWSDQRNNVMWTLFEAALHVVYYTIWFHVLIIVSSILRIVSWNHFLDLIHFQHTYEFIWIWLFSSNLTLSYWIAIFHPLPRYRFIIFICITDNKATTLPTGNYDFLSYRNFSFWIIYAIPFDIFISVHAIKQKWYYISCACGVYASNWAGKKVLSEHIAFCKLLSRSSMFIHFMRFLSTKVKWNFTFTNSICLSILLVYVCVCWVILLSRVWY